jgi:hypothetical protein
MVGLFRRRDQNNVSENEEGADVGDRQLHNHYLTPIEEAKTLDQPSSCKVDVEVNSVGTPGFEACIEFSVFGFKFRLSYLFLLENYQK